MHIGEYLAPTVIGLPLLTWTGFHLLVMARGSLTGCPHCLSRRFRDALRRGKDSVLLPFIAPQRCGSCRKRFYTFKSASELRRANQRLTRTARRRELAHS
jgi:hypothetical protein